MGKSFRFMAYLGCAPAAVLVLSVPRQSNADFVAATLNRGVSANASAEDTRTMDPGDFNSNDASSSGDGPFLAMVSASAGDGGFSGEGNASQDSLFSALQISGTGDAFAEAGGDAIGFGTSTGNGQSLISFEFLVDEVTRFRFTASAQAQSISGGESSVYQIGVIFDAPLLGETYLSLVDNPGPGSHQYSDSGVASGVLQPGIGYRIQAYASPGANVFPSSSAEASFEFRLVPVPEPALAGMLLWAYGCILFVTRQRRQRWRRCR
jgi:hypothetical protein